MALRVGILSTAHLHVHGYFHGLSHHPEATIVGVWDDVVERGELFAQKTGLPFVGYLDDLLDAVDAVVICSENNGHIALIEAAAKRGKAILCEKPVVAKAEDVARAEAVIAETGVKFMTAFPCRFSPAFQRLKERVAAGEIGAIKAISATNQGRCPFGWFVEPEKSGGGAMIDHVVHVTDLLRNLLGEEPVRVQAQTGNNMYGKEWDDTAMVTIEFPSGVFATLDSSWSRPQNYKTWGGVTMTVVGETGVIELDMFGQGVLSLSGQASLSGYGSDLDSAMIGAFVRACIDDTDVPVTLHDGLQAARVSLAGYASVNAPEPIAVG